MKNVIRFLTFSLLLFYSLPGIFPGEVAISATKFLTQPALSQNKIAFVYCGDLWVADLNGQNVRRLTSDDGIESNPQFSPDGKTIAFSAQYDGNIDVFCMPAEGGIPKRLTWHPGEDIVRGFTPDGSAILFSSQRSVFTNRYTRLYTVTLQGDFPTPIDLPYAHNACYSPDGKRLAYSPLADRSQQWKNYRGGTVSTIWIYTFKDHAVQKLPQPEGRCNDSNPMWIGDKIYFRSDRNGEYNLFGFDVKSQQITQITHFKDFPVLSTAYTQKTIIFEQAGQLHLFDLVTGRSTKLDITITTDLAEVRPRFVKGTRYIRNAELSPTGARAVFDFRGEIITVPAEKGDPRNLTNSPGVHERFPTWSPDGKSIACFSDASGEYELHVIAQDGKGDVKKYKLNGAGYYGGLNWSPDSKKLSFEDNGRTLYWIDLAQGTPHQIAAETIYLPGELGYFDVNWSPDSKWLAYTLNTAAYIQKVYLYSLDQNKSFPVTDGLSEVSNPVFDKSGKYLYFFSSTDAGPVKHWFAMSNADMRLTRSLYFVTLRKDVASPLTKESDEEKGIESSDKDKKEEKKDEKSKETPFSIDLDGLDYRILALPVAAGNYYSLQVGDEGSVYYLEVPTDGAGAKGPKLHKYNLKKQEDKVIGSDINSYQISIDKKKILLRSGENWSITDLGDDLKTDKGRLNINAIEVKIDPKQEWAQIFHEAWRINRDYFYATNMHGADWDAMQKKYAAFLPDVACRNDLNRLIQWMCSELAVGHHRVGGGDLLEESKSVPGGLLGADYRIENNRYCFEKVYGGLNWTPDLKSPLTEPGNEVKAGEYLLAVGGKELTAATNLFSLFENTAGKIVEITVGPNPNMTGSRTVKVVPIENEYALRNRDWVEGNIRKVDQATNGQVAYVYVPNTTTQGHTYFKRYFFPQVEKKAIIVDERFNGGGQVADYYIDILSRPYVCNWHTRYGMDFQTPSAAIQGPKVMLIDETAGSGGDLLPWMFRKFKLGTLIGKRTWGGLVGTLGFPVLMDGGYVSAPNLAIWTEDGWVVENEGVPPDIEVEQTPAAVINGHDPQLEKAIEVIQKELKQNPPKKMERPAYPIRIRKD